MLQPSVVGPRQLKRELARWKWAEETRFRRAEPDKSQVSCPAFSFGLVCCFRFFFVAGTQFQANGRVRRARERTNVGERDDARSQNRGKTTRKNDGSLWNRRPATVDAAHEQEMKKISPQKVGFKMVRRGDHPRLYYEAGEAGLWLSGRGPNQGPHCAALLAQGWPRLRVARIPSPGLPQPTGPAEHIPAQACVSREAPGCQALSIRPNPHFSCSGVVSRSQFAPPQAPCQQVIGVLCMLRRRTTDTTRPSRV